MTATEWGNNPVLKEDLEKISLSFKQHDFFKNSRVLVTGATGLIGSLLVKSLAVINRMHSLNMEIIAFVRNEEKAKKVFSGLLNREDISLCVGDITAPLFIQKDIDYIFHTASITTSKTYVTKPVETLNTAIDGTRNILELAKNCSAKGVVYVSSMEAFGITDAKKEKIKEEDLGYIDILSVRSSYSEGKRICETLSAAYAAEYGVPVKIARLAQTFGAGVSSEDGRMFAAFTKSALKGEDIVLHTKGESVGNYCYTSDAITALITILCYGENGEAYTVVNEATTMKIKDVAALVSETVSMGKSKLVFDIPENSLTFGYAPDVTMHLSSEKLRSLMWEPTVNLKQMFERLASSFKEES
ncbi:MAG: NAD-dependent epimerase/dehydratase family protein [Clostridia bacterium]|nr:NAD-dependent epimerase/dehydratase family protein [Clostridia bacterium]